MASQIVVISCWLPWRCTFPSAVWLTSVIRSRLTSPNPRGEESLLIILFLSEVGPHSLLASARSSPRACDQVYLFFFFSYLSHLIILYLVSVPLLCSLLQASWMGLQDFAVYTPMWILNQIPAPKKVRFPQILFQSSFRVLLRLSHFGVLSWILFWTMSVVEGDTQSWSQPCQSKSSVSQFSCSVVWPHGQQQSKFWVLIKG